MLEKWKRSADSGKAFGALLTDLSKDFWLPRPWASNCPAKCFWI